MQSAARRTMEEAMSGCDSTPLIGRISGKEREEKKEAQEQKKNKSDRSRFRIPIISIIHRVCCHQYGDKNKVSCWTFKVAGLS